jgi:hypothetical protein
VFLETERYFSACSRGRCRTGINDQVNRRKLLMCLAKVFTDTTLYTIAFDGVTNRPYTHCESQAGRLHVIRFSNHPEQSVR